MRSAPPTRGFRPPPAGAERLIDLLPAGRIDQNDVELAMTGHLNSGEVPAGYRSAVRSTNVNPSGALSKQDAYDTVVSSRFFRRASDDDVDSPGTHSTASRASRCSASASPGNCRCKTRKNAHGPRSESDANRRVPGAAHVRLPQLVAAAGRASTELDAQRAGAPRPAGTRPGRACLQHQREGVVAAPFDGEIGLILLRIEVVEKQVQVLAADGVVLIEPLELDCGPARR